MPHTATSSSSSRKASRSAASTRGSSRARGTSRRSASNALTLLRADHDAVLQLFAKFEKASRSEQKQKLATQICTELKIHTQIEDEIFYPAVREAADEDAQGALAEAEVEHEGATKLIEEIEGGGADEPKFDAQVHVLGEYVKHHIKEEYRSIFPAARAAELDLDELGAQLAARKKELKAEQRRH